MALTIDNIVTQLAAAQRLAWFKNFPAGKAIGSFVSGWLATGVPAAGANPPAYTAGSGYTCSDATAGAIQPYTNQANGQNRILLAEASAALQGTIHIVDRLWACQGMGFAAATYTITTPGALPGRITNNGVGVEAWVEVYNVATGAATGTLTFNYTNPGGTGEAGVIPTVVSAAAISQMQRIPLQTGSTGVKAPVSVVTSNTWTSGTAWGITLAKPVLSIPLSLAGVASVLDWANSKLAALPDDVCLQVIWQGPATTAVQARGSFAVGDMTE
jgi:hypothetical protein